ncbi:hypothetical protein FOCG_05557 [Fusarium oxysporum f. sp. radicis-lycopersici 26381]|nr:hypothetical protein FOCG_05557 [Fusarium oxysporum f. sp. radicis-lycopersici 26381]EXL54734.1 hypothetical protein FOCG_05557 [Fusarium oxysporum f. sp. radicis-lycopersici 26381]EXL54735.1 hypothetical protein FOCG_05557 [Fusarium oxysporum f. sp. radicis-lycopersici 26381]EXL54736.1 hypothetical protein FOCG_05557 [Fusarium oxysporum f. sp. radicis-lycopersici 26381]EXL54737.1 hypothetical protein FOCG_05557 [Fusarium oxysporum f. sp. radicis-lycopersici 26381]
MQVLEAWGDIQQRKTRFSPALSYLHRLRSYISQCVLMFADIQSFTALAILISAYVAMGCDIVAYHWQYMIYLAWMASVTHLASLSFLRNHLTNNFVKCIWRLTAMAVIQILLSVAVGLATTFGDNPWYREADQLIGIEVPPAEGGRPAICYFKQGVDVNSITFSSGVKMILLLLWGFSIRIAKMFERFEGGLRKFAYCMHHKSRILRYGVDAGSTTQIWDPRARRKGQGFFGHLLEPFKIAILVVLSIQLDFLTSFLAEVYWLLFTIIYITTRLVKFRIPSPADDNKWTFGQVLPLILLVAPIAIAIESFYTAPKTHTPQMTHTNTQQMNGPGSGLDPVAGLGHVDSLAYRGVFFLAALSYIEVGIYFVLDQPDTEGLALPLLQIALSILLLQPLYQIYWVVCDVFLSKAIWSRPLKLTTYDTLFLGSSAMQVSLNFCALNFGIANSRALQAGTASQKSVALLLFFSCNLIPFCFTYLLLVNLIYHMPRLRATRWRFAILLFFPCYIFLSFFLMSCFFRFLNWRVGVSYFDPYMLVTAVALKLLQLLAYGLEVWADRKHWAKWVTFCLRCVLLLAFFSLCSFLNQMLDYAFIFLLAGGFALSYQIWAFIGVSFYMYK